MHDISLIAFASAVLLLAGAVKGFIGLGMPTVALVLLTFKLDARSAVTLILIPMLLSNVWQFWRGPDMVGCAKRHWRYAAILILCVAGTVWFSQSTPDRFLRAVLGAFVLAFCFFSWRDMVPPIPSSTVRLFEIISALVAGLVGGLTAAWAPPLAMYLTGLRLERDAFVQALGFLITAGSVSVLAMFIAVGHSSQADLAVSVFLLVPTLIGFSAGERLRHRANSEAFKGFFLGAFSLLGANLLLGTLWG
ncbi:MULTISPECIES: sulfite exporter TauE/SafE family protein [unclassified Ruegeria]|uniref:sulfite exporter TauE/SafE family protein n=1 Tax=unclassified Ruegeria TaxID=2625375 RepID=UPI0014892B08|nr:MULTISPECIES: sulfite exporter TauE/SafE family protein [unclassified Ruegeria]NOD36449.1 TSUP family transporter [Ruegeria sp. HKCCD7296]NOD49695.1 TSUP family transporter [Ruegeria sp. HKCCD5849]NOD53951.1 TSUP family transporter [Ruegeria sp. HKCCD5851]NOD68896.1 TSUP family transporter [Ruegeria sp. HKCCD7303]NOE34552.1 TSUP family transporter [Ruegeria sp. HKCCD7318]